MGLRRFQGPRALSNEKKKKFQSPEGSPDPPVQAERSYNAGCTNIPFDSKIYLQISLIFLFIDLIIV